ncbi:MAG: hypothetical protein LBF72_03180 [Holosporales bacterium]|nr:hypothetical protein [Holosporales bacterium]
MYVSIRAPDRRPQKLILKSLERGPVFFRKTFHVVLRNNLQTASQVPGALS